VKKTDDDHEFGADKMSEMIVGSKTKSFSEA